eukprot:TRINITY_DN3991_c0_g1_i1.p1 TRINITY_DN3991_c0_g1~~TRINITY_DN3991_c0_g1_i1.p1  ORF type:complete len:331 (+),score=143.55 TRINITY_DN3991_c0_g1_i1:3-995(+)
MSTFRGVVQRVAEGEKIPVASVETLPVDSLPEGEVLISVQFSGVNYKDAMILKDGGRLVKAWPHIPGIDMAGEVEQSSSEQFKAGDKVIVTGWRVGEIHWGGMASKARVPAKFVTHQPEGINARTAMVSGTAGVAAALCVKAVESVAKTETIAVTGATGGVGSIAVALLSNLGYKVAAVTRNPTEKKTEYLKALGATEIVDAVEWSEAPRRPLGREVYGGAIDTVGGAPLSNLLTLIKYGGVVAVVGLAASPALTTTVLPFLLRAVTMAGIDSVMIPAEKRDEVWKMLSAIPQEKTDLMVEKTVTLEEVAGESARVLSGETRGRVLVACQ